MPNRGEYACLGSGNECGAKQVQSTKENGPPKQWICRMKYAVLACGAFSVMILCCSFPLLKRTVDNQNCDKFGHFTWHTSSFWKQQSVLKATFLVTYDRSLRRWNHCHNFWMRGVHYEPDLSTAKIEFAESVLKKCFWTWKNDTPLLHNPKLLKLEFGTFMGSRVINSWSQW